MHKTQTKLLQAIKKQPESTIRQLQKFCDIKHLSVVEYHLNKLMAAGLIKKINRWEIIEKE